MIIPSIDLMKGNAVQLVGGREMKLNAGDPRPIAETFKLAGDVAVVDLDAALGQGDNTDTIKDLLKIAPCRVGGGIRSVDKAIEWLDAGATRIVMGTAAKPEILKELPPERVIAALDATHGEVVVEGWRKGTGKTVIERMKELEGLVGGFLVTFVELEGRMQGTNLEMVKKLKDAAGKADLTIAGGVTTAADIAAVDRMGADAQVGMALYTDTLPLADGIVAPLTSDRPDGLWPTVVVDEYGVALGLTWSNLESVREAVKRRRGVYHSRSRGLWVKGETSGATQELLRINLDCDRDALRFTVRQSGEGFCHLNTWSCWGETEGLPGLSRLLAERKQHAPAGSYTARLFNDPELLKAKLLEEAGELAAATDKANVAWEAADVIYFTLVAMAKAGVKLSDVEAELARRALKVTRRKGDAKK
ncbi:MAG: phosphoribosyl-ATP diphosphatase [Planctomycetaceae bacterium]|nr:phosphoribosyl-ATP diphosphatase [Planctomycetaceae bacterium]